MKNNFQWWLVKIDRFGAWVLLATVILFFITSYGMEKGFLDQKTARWLHTDFLPVVGAVAFILHTGPAVRMALMRNKLWNKITGVILFAIYIFLAAGFVWAAFFYQSGVPDSAVPSEKQNQTQNISESDARIFTAQDLARYNGKNGNPAYIAVDGTVYDVSSLYINGMHKGCSAGKDATAEFYQDHSKQILTRYPIMGTLK